MNATSIKTAVYAVSIAATTVASAVVRQLPTPQESTFPDTERSRVVSVASWSDDGRRVNLSVSAHVTVSNNVQFALGQDLNGDEDLEPEEVQIVAGVDGGVWFVRDERPNPRPNLVTEGWTEDECSTPTNVVMTIRLKQVSAASNRFDLAKVTVRGRDPAAAEIMAEPYSRGTVLSVR